MLSLDSIYSKPELCGHFWYNFFSQYHLLQIIDQNVIHANCDKNQIIWICNFYILWFLSFHKLQRKIVKYQEFRMICKYCAHTKCQEMWCENKEKKNNFTMDNFFRGINCHSILETNFFVEWMLAKECTITPFESKFFNFPHCVYVDSTQCSVEKGEIHCHTNFFPSN